MPIGELTQPDINDVNLSLQENDFQFGIHLSKVDSLMSVRTDSRVGRLILLEREGDRDGNFAEGICNGSFYGQYLGGCAGPT